MKNPRNHAIVIYVIGLYAIAFGVAVSTLGAGWVFAYGDQQHFLEVLPGATIINGFVALVLSIVQARGKMSKAITLFVMYLTCASVLWSIGAFVMRDLLHVPVVWQVAGGYIATTAGVSIVSAWRTLE